jgi:hypothetical protein
MKPSFNNRRFDDWSLARPDSFRRLKKRRKLARAKRRSAKLKAKTQFWQYV